MNQGSSYIALLVRSDLILASTRIVLGVLDNSSLDLEPSPVYVCDHRVKLWLRFVYDQKPEGGRVSLHHEQYILNIGA